MYLGLTELARQAELDGDLSRASNIRSALAAADQCAIEELRSLSDTYDTGMSPAPQRSQLQPAPDEPTATAAALLSPASTPPEFEWFSAYKLLRGLTKRLCDMGWSHACMQVDAAHTAISRRIMRSFRQAGGQTGQLHVCFTEVTKPERAWRVLQGMLAQAECSSDAQRVYELRATASAIAKVAYNKLAALTDKYGPIEKLSSMSTEDLRVLQTRLAIVEPSILATQPGGPSASVAPEAAAIPQHPATAPETTTPSLPATAATPCAVPQASPWLQDDYAVERALIAGNLPPGFDASRLISDAYTFDRFGIAAELKAGRLPMQVINERLREREESAEAASDALLFQYLRFFKENVQSVMRAAYPGRAEPEWLDQVRKRLRAREETGTVTPPPATDPWSMPPGPSSQALGMPPTGTPAVPRSPWPGPQAAESSGTGPASAGSPGISLAQRELIVRHFESEDVLLGADYSLHWGGADVLGWSIARCRQVLQEVRRIHEVARSDPEQAAALIDIDWNALGELIRILDNPSPSP